MEDKGDPSSAEAPETIKPTRKGFSQTRGFGRTTVAKREGAGDMEAGSLGQQPPRQHSLALGRTGRQPQHTERVEEFLTAAQHQGRQNVPVSLADSSEPTSCPVPDVETALEGSVGSTSEMKSGPYSGSLSVQERPASSGKATGSKEKEDTSDNDSDGLTLKELQNHFWRKREQEPPDRPLKGIQNHLRKKRREENPTGTVHVKAGTAVENALPSKQEPETVQRVVSQAVTNDQENQWERTAALQVKVEESRDSGKPKPECELHDRNTLDRMCLQPRNNRFLSCCDRCEERFCGDCGGASQARGKLLERNREDYICPNCTVLQVQDETKAETTDHRETKFRPGDAGDTEFTSTGTVEQKSSEDRKIKRRVEKAANPSRKKKLKLCQPVVEAPGTSRCPRPGCSTVVQPNLAYCSKDSILTHAAATMKCLSSGKEQKPKSKEKIKMKPEKPSLPETSVLKIQSSIKPGATRIDTASSKRAAVTTKSFEPPAKESVRALPSFHQDSNTKADDGVSAAPWPDPTVQQFGQFSKAQALEEEEEDQPHSPEEEQNLERALDAQLAKRGTCHDVEAAPESGEREEVACDPEDETVLEAKMTIEDVPNRMCADMAEDAAIERLSAGKCAPRQGRGLAMGHLPKPQKQKVREYSHRKSLSGGQGSASMTLSPTSGYRVKGKGEGQEPLRPATWLWGTGRQWQPVLLCDVCEDGPGPCCCGQNSADTSQVMTGRQ
ncbi:death-inducer obliterator 1-like [Cynocephalus volans]|uniref:death-inducer obliterator 1-like n=1 Tax=Cynocephalus volans TaxID=110931 RepID=UPI002FCAD126